MYIDLKASSSPLEQAAFVPRQQLLQRASFFFPLNLAVFRRKPPPSSTMRCLIGASVPCAMVSFYVCFVAPIHITQVAGEARAADGRQDVPPVPAPDDFSLHDDQHQPAWVRHANTATNEVLAALYFLLGVYGFLCLRLNTHPNTRMIRMFCTSLIVACLFRTAYLA